MALAVAGFTLGIRPVASLLPHEETIPPHVGQLSSEMTREGIQRDPIIIDGNFSAILDGMHRIAAFKALRIDNAVCCSVDYSSRSVSLGRWARVYAMKPGDSVEDALEGFEAERTSLAEAFSALERREAVAAVLAPEAAFVRRGGDSHSEMVDALKAMDRLAEGKKWTRTFVPEDEVDVPLQQPGKFVLLPRRLTKDDVLTAARTGKLFPCKTSMHLVDPRPVALNFPLRELNRATSAKLKESLAGNKGRLIPPGSDYEGRRYKERLLRFDRE
jgi:hypothetical protein